MLPLSSRMIGVVVLLPVALTAGAVGKSSLSASFPAVPQQQALGIRSGAEIAKATFVELDFDRFPRLPAWDVPKNDVIFVSTTGNDRATGRKARPFRTLARALRAASPGDTIVVRSGVYRESWSPGDHRALALETNNLKVMAAPGERVTLRPGPGVEYGITINARHLVIRGFRLEGFASVGILFEPGRVRNRDVVLANLEIIGSAESIAIWEAEGSVDELLLVDVRTDSIVHCGTGPCSNWRLERVNIDAAGGQGWGADAFAIEAGDNILLVETTVRGAASDGIDTKATRVVILDSRVRGVGNNAIKLWHGGDIINTLIWRGWQPPVWVEEGRFRLLHSVVTYPPALVEHRDYSLVCGYDRREPMQIEIVNSIISNPSGAVWINSETFDLAVHNTIFHTADGSEILVHGDFAAGHGKRGITAVNRGYGAGNLAADPRLKRNLKPRRSSPAVDAGMALDNSYPAFDRRGRRRSRGQAPDIGAYELPKAPQYPSP